MNPLRWLSVSLTLATAEAPTVLSLELVAGKLRALPIAVQPARGIRCRNGTGSP